MTKGKRQNTKFRVKRIYDEASDDDGTRVLVDRLWPRGMTKAAARIDLWAQVAAPTAALRKWFHDDHSRHVAFTAMYLGELEERRSEIAPLFEALGSPIITLLTAAKDPQAGHVPVLLRFLQDVVHK